MTHHIRYNSKSGLCHRRVQWLRCRLTHPFVAQDWGRYTWDECQWVPPSHTVGHANVYNLLGIIMRLLEAKLRLAQGEERAGKLEVDEDIPDRVSDLDATKRA